MTEGGATRKRKRPSAKEARERMARAVGSQAPISRTEETAKKAHKQTTEKDQGTNRTKLADELSGGEARTSRRATAATQEAAPRLVRLSVDVPSDQHRRLRVMAAESDTTGMALIRALLAEMEDDPELAARVRDRLAELGR